MAPENDRPWVTIQLQELEAQLAALRARVEYLETHAVLIPDPGGPPQ